MKILAIEKENLNVTADDFQPHLKTEAAKLWELHQSGSVRELYFREDRSEAVLVLECESLAEAHRILGSLPLVQEGLITFEVIPLRAYPGFARLFQAEGK